MATAVIAQGAHMGPHDWIATFLDTVHTRVDTEGLIEFFGSEVELFIERELTRTVMPKRSDRL